MNIQINIWINIRFTIIRILEQATNCLLFLIVVRQNFN